METQVLQDTTEAAGIPEAQRAELKAALQHQLQHPVSLDDVEQQILANMFGVTGSPLQREAVLTHLNLVKAKEYVSLIDEVVSEAKAQGIDIEIPVKGDMEEAKKHELQHVAKASDEGFDLGQCELGAGFYRYTNAQGESRTGMEMSFGGIEMQGDPVRRAKVDLAPDHPSGKDLNVFVSRVQRDKAAFLSNPLDTIGLFRKFSYSTGMSPLGLIRLFSQ